MEYIKNDDGTFSIISETTEIVKLEDLEARIKEIEDFNADVRRLEIEKELLPESIKKYVIIPGEMLIDEKTVELIATLKALNG